MKKRTPKEKKMSAFCRGALIYAAVLILIFAAALGVLTFALRAYETNLPEKTAEKFVSEMTEERLTELISDTLDSIGELESPTLILSRSKYLSTDMKQGKLVKEYTSDTPVYRLVCGEHDVGKLTLRRAKKDAPFGISRWEIAMAELYPEAIEGGGVKHSYEICVPAGATLKANGKTVSAEALISKNIKYSGKAEQISVLQCDIYSLDGLYTAPELLVTYEDSEAPLVLHGGYGDWFTQQSRTFILTVPEGADVTISGKAPHAERAEAGNLTEAVSEFEKELGDKLPGTVSYTVCGGEGAEEHIAVSVGGELLSGKWHENNGKKSLIYLHSEKSRISVHATVPHGATLYINGVEVSSKYLSGDGVFPSLSELTYLSGDGLLGDLYEIGGLLCSPELSAEADGEPLELCRIAREKQTVTAEFYGRADNSLENVGNAAVDFTKAYFHYVANGAVGIEENYAALIEKMLPGSPGHTDIKRSKASFEFVNQGTYKINKTEPRRIITLGGGLYYCVLDFSVDLYFYKNHKLYEGELSLVFLENDGILSVCLMQIESKNS